MVRGMIQGRERILSIAALLISLFLASACVHSPRAQPAATDQTFPCNDPKPRALGAPSSRHRVTLSWKASVSLSPTFVAGEGYNLYRLNPDGSCVKVNNSLIQGTLYEDQFVELGKTYRYAAKAVKHNHQSGSSNIVEVVIPRV